MNELRQQVFHTFAGGSVEEIAAALALIAAVSTHPKTRGADQNFPHPVGSTKDDDTKQQPASA
jgi:hypothetical protein